MVVVLGSGFLGLASVFGRVFFGVVYGAVGVLDPAVGIDFAGKDKILGIELGGLVGVVSIVVDEVLESHDLEVGDFLPCVPRRGEGYWAVIGVVAGALPVSGDEPGG